MFSFSSEAPFVSLSLHRYSVVVTSLPLCVPDYLFLRCVALLFCDYLVSPIQKLTNFFLVLGVFFHLDQFSEVVVPVPQEERSVEHRRREGHISQLSPLCCQGQAHYLKHNSTLHSCLFCPEIRINK